MSRKFKTTQEERDDILKYSLLRRAQQAKRYYEDGLYKPQTVLNQELKKQSDFYEQIDEISARVASDLYGEDTAEGRYYTDVTAAKTKKFMEQLDKFLRNGLLTADQYNDILGYVSLTVGTAIAGEDATISKRRMALKKDPVGKLVNEQLKKNLTQLSIPAIEQLAETAGETRKEIQKLREGLLGSVDTVNLASGAYPSNISQPIPISQQGEETIQVQNYEGQNVQGGTPQIRNAGALDGIQRSLDEIKRRNYQTNSMLTTTYGLPADVYHALNFRISALIEDSLNNKVSQDEFYRNLGDMFSVVKSKYPQFEDGKALRMWSNGYDTLYGQAINREAGIRNHANSAQAIAGDELANLRQAYDDQTSQLDDRGLLPTHATVAQTSATQGNITLQKQLAYTIEKLPEDFAEIFVNISKGEQPASITGYDGTLDQMEGYFENTAKKIIGEINKLLRSGAQVDVVHYDSDLEALKAMFRPETLELAIEWLNPDKIKASIQTWPYYRFNQSANPLKDTVDTLINPLIEVLQKTATKYKKMSSENPSAWSLKIYLSENVVDATDGFRKWISTQGAPAAMSGQGRKKPIVAGKQTYKAPDWKKLAIYYKTGAPAMTTQLYKNPTMRFIVGDGELNNI